MKYLYYPGCSAEATGKPFEESLLEVFKILEISFEELHQWNCCGATAYMSIDELKAFALAARNLALAEKQGLTGAMETVDLFTSCAACYLVLLKTHKYIEEYPEINDKMTAALSQTGLQYGGRVRVRHALDVLVNDIGIERISKRVKKPLSDLRVACYYGCQIVRPYALFDDPENPSSMDQLIEVTGAGVVGWPLKTRCCGGSLMGTIPDVGLRLNHIILREAQKHGADVIATACPLCQFNLECYQDKIVKQVDRHFTRIPVAFFTQLLGLAFGINERKLGIQRLFMPIKSHWKFKEGGPHVRQTAASK
jgi:heterodisulfide reductase subunit B